MKDSFIFYKSFFDALINLDDETRLKCYDAISGYAITGVAPELNGVALSIFSLIKPQIDANSKRYENGKKGGKKPNPNQSRTEAEPNPNRNRTKAEPKANQSRTEAEPNENENVNVNENENVNDKIPPSPLGGGIEPKTPASADNLAWFDLHASEVNISPQLAKKARNWLLSIGDKHRRLAEIDVVDFLELLEQKERQYGTEAVLDRISRDMSAGYKNIMWDKLTVVEPVSTDKQDEPPTEEAPQEESPGWSEERWDAYYSRLDKKYRVDAEKLGMTLDEYYCSASYAHDEKRDQAEADKMGMHLDEYFDYLDGKSRDSPNDSSGVREGGME